jgi:hypothetical protein
LIGAPPYWKWIRQLCPFGNIHCRPARHEAGIEPRADRPFVNADADEYDFLAAVAIDLVPVLPQILRLKGSSGQRSAGTAAHQKPGKVQPADPDERCRRPVCGRAISALAHSRCPWRALGVADQSRVDTSTVQWYKHRTKHKGKSLFLLWFDGSRPNPFLGTIASDSAVIAGFPIIAAFTKGTSPTNRRWPN